MTRIDLITLIKNNAVSYVNGGVVDSIKRNSHMNDYSGEQISDETILAIMTDFVNYVAAWQGVDYAMYTKDFKKEIIDFQTKK